MYFLQVKHHRLRYNIVSDTNIFSYILCQLEEYLINIIFNPLKTKMGKLNKTRLIAANKSVSQIFFISLYLASLLTPYVLQDEYERDCARPFTFTVSLQLVAAALNFY